MICQKRKYPRYYSYAMAEVIGPRNSKKFSNVVVTNISIGGLAFLSEIMFYPGEKVVFYFSSLAIKVAGTIRRVYRNEESYSHGVEFKKISFMNKIILDKTLRNQGN